MRVRARLLRLSLAALGAAMLSACGSGAGDALDVVVIGEPDAPFQTGIRLGLPGQMVRGATVEGLVGFDAQGRVVPALADRWIVTDDGQSYIFRLRDGTWRDGSELTGRDARRAFERVLRELRGTSLGLDLSAVDEVRDMAGRVVEIRLSRPVPHFLQMLAQPELGLSRQGVGAGPMALVREKNLAILTPIAPQDLGLPEISNWEERARTIHLRALPGEQAVDRFNEGDSDLVVGGGIADFPYAGSVGILRGTIQLDPVIGLFGLAVTHEKGFLSEAANREALAMAIDRDALIAPFGLDGWTQTTRIVAPGLDGDLGTIGERWADMTMEERRALALTRVARWRGKPDQGADPVTLRIRMPAGPGADMLYKRLAADFAAIGLATERAADGKGADLQLVEDVARYPRARWFFNRLSCAASNGPCSKEADARVREANGAQDEAQRAALLAEAEVELTQANVFIPFGAPIRWSLVRGSIDAFATNPWGWHPLMPLAMLPK